MADPPPPLAMADAECEAVARYLDDRQERCIPDERLLLEILESLRIINDTLEHIYRAVLDGPGPPPRAEED